jgi:hypothetical protein
VRVVTAALVCQPGLASVDPGHKPLKMSGEAGIRVIWRHGRYSQYHSDVTGKKMLLLEGGPSGGGHAV